MPCNDDSLPESIGAASRIWLDDEPNDPNVPDAAEEQLPEAVPGVPAVQNL